MLYAVNSYYIFVLALYALCYIQNKMDSEAKEAIVKLASQFFKYEDIITAKKLLYETVPVTRRRLIIHRGMTRPDKRLLTFIITSMQLTLTKYLYFWPWI